mmetsp:Transcript_5532/g.34239  ORF Transcript_5532/g.34239 Transcript_5532/m.34239 type:complete len:125 (+) Transcript_5532:176-550(+)
MPVSDGDMQEPSAPRHERIQHRASIQTIPKIRCFIRFLQPPAAGSMPCAFKLTRSFMDWKAIQPVQKRNLVDHSFHPSRSFRSTSRLPLRMVHILSKLTCGSLSWSHCTADAAKVGGLGSLACP